MTTAANQYRKEREGAQPIRARKVRRTKTVRVGRNGWNIHRLHVTVYEDGTTSETRVVRVGTHIIHRGPFGSRESAMGAAMRLGGGA